MCDFFAVMLYNDKKLIGKRSQDNTKHEKTICIYVDRVFGVGGKRDRACANNDPADSADHCTDNDGTDSAARSERSAGYPDKYTGNSGGSADADRNDSADDSTGTGADDDEKRALAGSGKKA